MDSRTSSNTTARVTDKIDVTADSAVKRIMNSNDIKSASLAYFSVNNPIDLKVIVNDQSSVAVTEETRYRVASLSKTVFGHLVEKLIEENNVKNENDWLGKFDLSATNLDKFDLDTPLSSILPFQGLSGDDIEKAKSITARMVLSHTTGLPGKPGEGPHELLFTPGKGYAYSNLSFTYLQKIIEKLTKSPLQPLAQKHIFTPLGMHNSSFYPGYELGLISDKQPKPGYINLKCTNEGLKYQVVEVINKNENKLRGNFIPWEKLPNNFPRNDQEIIEKQKDFLPVLLDITSENGDTPKAIAQNSLHTTPSDFARCAMEMMNTQAQHEAFKINKVFKDNGISMMNDEWAVKQGLSEKDLSRISWGTSWALQLDANGEPEKAFHWGDYGDQGLNWTALVVLDLKKKEGMVSMTDSRDGLLLADQFFNENTVGLEHGLEFIFKKYGFAREYELANSDWKTVQDDRISRIIAVHEEKIIINDNKDSGTLSIECDRTLSGWKSQEIIDGILDALNKFKAENVNDKDVCDIKIEKDSKGKISSLAINIPDTKIYDQFIKQLHEQKLLFALATTPQAEPTKPSDRKDSVKNSHHTISSTTNIFAAISQNPIEAAKHQSKITQTTSLPPVLPQQNEEKNDSEKLDDSKKQTTEQLIQPDSTHKSPTPFSTKPTPQGAKK